MAAASAKAFRGSAVEDLPARAWRQVQAREPGPLAEQHWRLERAVEEAAAWVPMRAG
jgi:hypothetical protein